MPRLARVLAPGYPHPLHPARQPRPTRGRPLLERAPDRAGFPLHTSGDNLGPQLLRRERTGRPTGEAAFLTRLEPESSRRLALRKPGPKPKKGN